jgi:phenylacetate-coenzyme A ligase PaaK-like adenylate-forming protein
LVVSERHVMFVAEPMDELKKQVIEQTTGIIMPNSDLGGGLSLV